MKVPIFFTWMIFILCFSNKAFTQNLVKNPSFEEYIECPEALGNVDPDVPYWSACSDGTTDYFNSCSIAMGTPRNFNGYQAPEFGEAYVGLYLKAPNNYREYLQGELEHPLKAGKKYEVSFYVSLADKSNYAIRDIGILFTPQKTYRDTKRAITLYGKTGERTTQSFMEVRHPLYYAKKDGWTQVTKTFKAKGNEKYLIIGNFRDDERSLTYKLRGVKSAAYYYLDMVSVSALPEDYPYNDLKTDKMYLMEDVVFATDVYELNENAKKELKRLYMELEKDKELYVTVHAHTDDTGSATYNHELSSKRAKSVADYLCFLGLPKKRIRWMGHGGERPIAENTSEEGKQKNRRATFMISNRSFEKRGAITETIFNDE